MQFMIMHYESAAENAKRNHPTQAAEYWGGWNAFIGAMAQAGIIVKGDGLLGPETATTVRVRVGKRTVQDGPFADTREHLGGYFIIDVPSLDVALDWAAKAPNAATGGVEIRPVMPPMPGKM
jgi:hypothetical protein